MLKRVVAILAVVIITGQMVSCGSGTPATSTNDEVSKQIESLRQELQAKEGEINNLQGQLKERDNEIARLEQEIEDLRGQSTEPTVEEPSAGVIETTVNEVYSAYEDNEISADQKYLNKILRVSGKVQAIRRDIGTGKPRVSIEDLRGYPGILECLFESESEAAPLSIGNKVTIEGKCVGFGPYTLLRLEGCSLVP